MTTHIHDQILDRREITSALVRALDRRHEVLDAVVDSKDHQSALTTVAKLLGTSEANAEAVLSLKFSALTEAARKRIQGELENLDATLEWTALDRPASSGLDFSLRPFSDSDEDRTLFAARSQEQIGDDGAPWTGDRVESERRSGLSRIDDETAAWFVAEDVSGATPTSVGLVFGELDGQEVNVAIWIAPESRKKGYGTACVKHSRRELAAEFPGTVLVVRAPA
ncbi:GNAT superfamily N-acetyltransferase [Rhodococcus sp. 27YEA15]|uniref:GNAT family N-acetyltransferase n=1 Tax=Rhodococcus sp. 27YEA15 TaxID=3156259 RepID=UPI003C7BBC2F